ncbi:MAG: hypothetical protein A2Y94_06435 [Caldithrix sp. RBG_13_44_9]|nr:MAG: hypothetical protein A2Y94_06435 [Caldithrix sp. RBG_13_44_9]
MIKNIFNLAVMVSILLFMILSNVQAENRELQTGAFEVTHQLTLPGSPEKIFDTVTGDISGWWDHSFSEKPRKFYIEPRPGGGFFEIFDEAGNGVKHAEVIFAGRGKILRFDGPLGLSGHAVKVVTTYTFESATGDSTLLKVTVNAAGEMEAGWAETVDRVWYHFLFEKLKPYVEGLAK